MITPIKNLFTKPRIPYGLFFIGLVLAAGAGSAAVTLKDAHDASVHVISLHHAVGDTVAINEITFSTENFHYDTKGVPGLAPQPGNQFLIPTIDVTNNTSAGFEMIPLLYFYIKDADGNVYHPTAAPLATDQLTGPIPPGEKVREEIGFEVPLDIKDPTLYFERGTPNHPVVAVDLTTPQ